MKQLIGLLGLMTLLIRLAAVGRESDLQSLYDSHQWFKLREAMPIDAPPFYRGAVACAFNHLREAESHFQTVIRSAPESEQAFDSYAMLANLYLRAGQYRQALAQLKGMIAIKPDDADAKDALPTFTALARYPDLAVNQGNVSTLRYKLKDGNLFLPLSIDGKPASYIFDTGANFSAISAGEAKRLGLAVDEGVSSGTDSTGGKIVSRTAVARELKIGEFQLENVPFLVFSDDRQPFADLPLGQRGVIGIPVLIALQSLRWSNDGTFEIGFPFRDMPAGSSNICFDDLMPIVEAQFQSHTINFVLDTGATTSYLWPLFAKEFADTVGTRGKKSSRRVTGVGGSVRVEEIRFPAIALRMGAFETFLRPAHILLKQTASTSQWYHGSIGLDVLSQAHRVGIDFKSLFLVLE